MNKEQLIAGSAISLSICLFGVYQVVKEYNRFELVILSPRASWLNSTQKLEHRAISTIESMIKDAEKDGMCIVVTSGYRSFEEQKRIKDKYGKIAEDPGKSEHQTGYAVDLSACPMKDGVRDDDIARDELKLPFEKLPEYKWVVDHSKKYRLSQTYSNEPWHWKFNR